MSKPTNECNAHLRVRLPLAVVQLLDEEVERGVFLSRSDAIRGAIESYFGSGQPSSATLTRTTDKQLSYLLFAFLLLNREGYAPEDEDLLWRAAENLAARDCPQPFQYLKSIGFQRPNVEDVGQ